MNNHLTKFGRISSQSSTPTARSLAEKLGASSSHLALEPRIAFDAAMAAVADQVVADAVDATSEVLDNSTTEVVSPADAHDVATAIADADNAALPDADATPAVIVIIDGAINDPELIVSAIPDGAEIIVLDRGADGLQQIADALAGYENIDAIHIVSHGLEGELRLGNSRLNAETIGGIHAEALAVIAGSLSESADILIYGCNVAEGEAGQSFISALSQVTGADIAASNDDTGSADLGGDWDLETTVGQIEAVNLSAPEWNGELAPLVISVSSPPTTNGLTGLGAVSVWTNAGTIGGTSIDIVARVVSATPGSVVQFSTAFGVDAYGPGRDADDLWLIVTGGTVTVQWEIYASGTNQTVAAVGDPNFRISDIDGDASVNSTFPTLEVESVAPNVESLTSYTVDNPTNLQTGISGGNLTVIGTASQNAESNSLVAFDWTNVSSWQVTYGAQIGWGARFYFHDGDGDFTFVSPTTTYMLGIDLDANDSAATGTSYQTTFTENSAAVAVVDGDVAIAQHAALGANIDSAVVVLTNAQASDQLLVNGSTAASGTIGGLSYTVVNSGGQITVTLTGSATPAAYQAALQAITFSNNSEAPSTVDRNITVNVTNATFGTTSNTAVSTIHVTAVNDAPVSTPLGNLTNDDADVVSVDVSGSFSDPDATDVLTFSATGLPPGLTIDPASGVISGTIAPNASVTGPYTVIVTATDPSGATTSETYTWTVNNPAPDAVDDVLGVTENALGAGDVIANDSDPDGDVLVVSAVNGVAGNVGNAVAGSNGGTFTVAANGSYSFDPSGDFDDLAV
ncbi:MAG: DUF4347 domain-containing protein, partial [Hyphomicrobiaceae bacterium]|nr:DUF4347 domain-containing protein [Hyphomicrobiaceae bacterium]